MKASESDGPSDAAQMIQVLKKIAYPILLFAAVIVTFAEVRHHDFINYDDPGYVTENRHVRTGLSKEGILWALKSTEQWNWHPVTWLSHMLDCEIFGLNPAGHHITSLLLHALSSVLLFSLMQRMTRSVGPSALLAALFSLHPLRMESVAWIAERKDVLGTLFWMLTTWAYLRYTQDRRPRRYLLMSFLFAIGLMCKPMLVTLPFALLLLDYWPLRRFVWEEGPKNGSRPGGKMVALVSASYKNRRLLWEKVPLLVLSAASSFVTYWAQQKGGSVIPLHLYPIGNRIANAFASCLNYMIKTIWPAGLAVFYPQPERIPVLQSVAAAMIVVVITLLALRSASHRPYLAVGWLWYLGVLVPVIGIVQVGNQAMADRYTYLPCIGLFMIAAYGGADLVERYRLSTKAAAAFAAAVVVCYAVVTFLQLRHWKDSVSLYRHALEVTGFNQPAYVNLGAALVAQGKSDEALVLYSEALKQNANFADAHVNIGVVLASKGKHEEAVEHYEKALRLEPHAAEAHNNLGVALAALGRLDEAAIHYNDALRAKPDYPEAHCNLGNVWLARGSLDPAVEEYRRALFYKPEYSEAHHKLAIALAGQNKLEQAIKHYRIALTSKTSNHDLHYRFAMALYRTQRQREALEHFREAVRLKPDWPDALNSTAWILATGQNLKPEERGESVRLAEKACELTAKSDPVVLDTLAAAYAATGRFDKAVEKAREALDQASANGNKGLAVEIRNRVHLYRQGQPYLEPHDGFPK